MAARKSSCSSAIMLTLSSPGPPVECQLAPFPRAQRDYRTSATGANFPKTNLQLSTLSAEDSRVTQITCAARSDDSTSSRFEGHEKFAVGLNASKAIVVVFERANLPQPQRSWSKEWTPASIRTPPAAFSFRKKKSDELGHAKTYPSRRRTRECDRADHRRLPILQNGQRAERRTKPIAKTAFPTAAASIILSHSATDKAMGFSTSK